MGDIYVIDFGDDDERARRAAEREAEFARLTERYAQHLVARTALDEATSRRVVAVLFEPSSRDGSRCECSCHPRLSAQHGDGFDCPCSWDEERRAVEAGTAGVLGQRAIQRAQLGARARGSRDRGLARRAVAGRGDTHDLDGARAVGGHD